MNKPMLWMPSALCAIFLVACTSQPSQPGPEPPSVSQEQPEPQPESPVAAPEPTATASEPTVTASEPTATATEPTDAGAGLLDADPIPDVIDQPARQTKASPGEAMRSDMAVGTDATPATMYSFMETVLHDVHAYWDWILTGSGYPSPRLGGYYFPMTGESYPSLCLTSGTNDDSMFYCGYDDSIFISQNAATATWNGKKRSNTDPESAQVSGDFSVAYVVAHEYAHNVQAELGILPNTVEEVEAGRIYPVYKTELQADCLAGTWANSAYYAGYLEAGDVEEAQRTALDYGDYIMDANHHGTPDQRLAAFMQGYNTGLPAECDVWVRNDY